MTTAPIYWIKKVEETLQESKVIPLWGTPPPFPWEKAAHAIAESLHFPESTLKAGDTRWLSAKEVLGGLGRNPIAVALEIPPLTGSLHLAFSSEDVSKLISYNLSSETPYKNFSDKGLQEGYFQFLVLNAIEAVAALKPYPDLSFKLGSAEAVAQDSSFCLDILLQIKGDTLMGRLICSSDFLHSFRSHFGRTSTSLLQSSLRHEIEVDLHFEVGTTSLSMEELKNVSQGDFVVLDRCFYDPKKRQGNLNVMLGKTALFQAILLDGKIEIADYSFYHEEDTPMNPEDNNPEEEIPAEENTEEESWNLEAGKETDHLWSPTSETSIKDIISTKNIPVVLTVEVGQLNMSLDRVLELKPGNVLDLFIHVDQPLDVKMNGKRIAKAELVKIGELLGIKILRMGD